MSENDFECFAKTGVNAPGTMFPDWGPLSVRFPRSRLYGPLGPTSFNLKVSEQAHG